MSMAASPQAQPTQRRTTQREKTRAQLLEYGRRAFARRGHAATNLKEDILLPAGVSVGSFYHQFGDKTDLFLEILEEHGNTFRQMVQEANRPREGVSEEQIARHSFETSFVIAEENEDLFHIMMRERESEDERVRDFLRQGRRGWTRGLMADYRNMLGQHDVSDEDLEMAAELVQSMTFGAIVQFLGLAPEEQERERPRLIDGLVRFSLGGLAALFRTAAPDLHRTLGKEPS